MVDFEQVNVSWTVLQKDNSNPGQQHACYNSLKENLSSNGILLHVDYSKNYANLQQGEIQKWLIRPRHIFHVHSLWVPSC